MRKSTHKCIGTFVKFSKQLEFVINQIVDHGLRCQTSQRTRQHSMLVIPALVSLKPAVVDDSSPCIKQLVSETIARLRDPAEIVAKTARKLIQELAKCYPDKFEKNFISTQSNSLDREICHLILSNQVDEALKLIEQTANQQSLSIGPQKQNVVTASSQQKNLSHFGNNNTN